MSLLLLHKCRRPPGSVLLLVFHVWVLCSVCHAREQPEQTEGSSAPPAFLGCVWAASRSE